ncbi:MAG: glycosyltransferase family 39 protein [Acidimicrobiales bacterium]
MLLAIGGCAGLSYGWGMGNFPLESFYAASARSMASSWRDFFFAALDPSGTITLDKLPGAIWLDAISVRIFGWHYWAVALPQVVEGVLTVLVLYRVVRLLSGPKTGLLAALILAASPVSALLNRGNVSDSLLVLLTVLAADATVRALLNGRLRTLLLAAVWIGLAFQSKMVQAWLIVPALFAAYLVSGPGDRRRRIIRLVTASVLLVLVSISWMTAVSLVPSHDRPYVDGTRDDSLFVQVFVYNGWIRAGIPWLQSDAALGDQPWQRIQSEENVQVGTYQVKPSIDRLLVGELGRDDAWLLPAALLSGICLMIRRRRRPRDDLERTGVILWGGWLLTLFLFFSFGKFINSYYTAALDPAIATLCAMGLAEAWRSRERSRLSRFLLLAFVPLTTIYAVVLVPSNAGVAWWLLPLAGVVCVIAEYALIRSLTNGNPRSNYGALAIPLASLSLLLAPAITTGVVVAQGLGSFSTPYQSATATFGTTTAPENYQDQATTYDKYWDRAPRGQILQAIDTSAAASPLIMVTGREFLPIGGFDGNVPSPTLRQLRHLVDTGRITQVFVPLTPAGHDPRMMWLRKHCLHTYSEPYGKGVEFALYFCVPSKLHSVAITPVVSPLGSTNATVGVAHHEVTANES